MEDWRFHVRQGEYKKKRIQLLAASGSIRGIQSLMSRDRHCKEGRVPILRETWRSHPAGIRRRTCWVWDGGRRRKEHHDSLAPGTVSRVEAWGDGPHLWARARFGQIPCGLCTPRLPRLWGLLNRGVLGGDGPVGTENGGESRQRGLPCWARKPRSTTGPEALASDDSPVRIGLFWIGPVSPKARKWCFWVSVSVHVDFAKGRVLCS